MGLKHSKREHREEKANRQCSKDVEKALKQQRKLYEQKLVEIFREIPIPASTTTGQQAHSNNNLDRQPIPYSYTQNYLQGAIGEPNALTLYPNLGDHGYSTGTAVGFSGYVNNQFGVGPISQFPSNFPSNFPHLPQTLQPQIQPSAPPADNQAFTNSRSRSQSRQRGSPNDDITCKTCGNMYGDKIYQCDQRHSSCNSCKTRQAACGQCRQKLTNRRNFQLERKVAETRVQCPNSVDGCLLSFKVADIETHTKECPFKELECPSLGHCTWAGKLTQLLQHFNAMHPTHRQANVGKEMLLSNVNNTSHTMHFIQIGPFCFLFHIKVSEADHKMYMAVQLIGTKHSAAKWASQVQVYNKSQPQRKHSYTVRCTSSSKPIEESFESTKCAVIPQEYVQTFFSGGALAYTFFMKRDDNVINTKESVYSKRGRRARRNV